MSVPAPRSISIPPPPPLDPPSSSAQIPDEPTNTLALLLPHQALFAPPVLALLKEHYEAYGRIAHWAPVRGFGRVIIVYERDEDAERAKREGDWLKLEVPAASSSAPTSSDGAGSSSAQTAQGASAAAGAGGQGEYFDTERGHRRRKSRSTLKDLILRLHYLPPTTLNPDPASLHLAVPALPHNFLISPPGSPPEGWEPIAEEAPNTSILAEDLQRALEALQLNGGVRAGKEVILDEGGVRVEVEDTTRTDELHADADDMVAEGEGRWDADIEETLQNDDENGYGSAWAVPTQSHNTAIHPAFASIQAGLGGLGSLGGSPLGTPGYKLKPIPTARPPV